MIELLISACLVARDDCRDHSLLYDRHEVNVTTCVSHGLVEVVRWQGRNPGWTVESWRCGVLGERDAEA